MKEPGTGKRKRNDDSRPRRVSDVWKNVPGDGGAYALVPSGFDPNLPAIGEDEGYVFRLSDGAHDVAAIAGRFAEDFQCPPATARERVEQALDHLAAEYLIVDDFDPLAMRHQMAKLLNRLAGDERYRPQEADQGAAGTPRRPVDGIEEKTARPAGSEQPDGGAPAGRDSGRAPRFVKPYEVKKEASSIDVLLIQAPTCEPIAYFEEPYSARAVSIGMGYLDACLRENGFTTGFLSFLEPLNPYRYLRKALGHFRPAIVGIGSTTLSHGNALRIARECKAYDADLPVVLGGAHVTFLDRETVAGPYVDMVVRGEGEQTFLELAGHLLRGESALEQIRGLTYGRAEDGGIQIQHNPARPLTKDLDRLPFPSRDLLPVTTPARAVGMISSRGCPNRCRFCAAAALSGGTYRIRSAESVVEEMEHVSRKGFRHVTFYDNTFTGIPERMAAICEAMHSRGIELTWDAFSRADVLNRETIRLMADLGCQSLNVGVESGCSEIMEDLGKNILLEQVEEVARFIEEEPRMNVHFNFLIGYGTETPESFEQTLSFCHKLVRCDRVRVGYSILTPLPGTDIWKDPEGNGITILTRDFDQYSMYSPVIRTRCFSQDDLRDQYYRVCTELG